MTEEFRIFLADDDEDDREFFRLALKNVNHNASLIAVSNGAEAIQFFSGADPAPHFVFLDINMPRVDGIECLKRIRAEHSAEQMPVIMLSTSRSPQMMKVSLQAGANFYLQKPNHLHLLTNQIRFCLFELRGRVLAERCMLNT